MIVLEGIGSGGSVRFNLNHLVGYNEQELWLLGQRLELTPGTAPAIDLLLREKSGVSFKKVEAIETSKEE